MITVLRQQRHSNGSGAVLARALGVSSAGPESRRVTRGPRYIINYGVTANPNWRQSSAEFSNTPTAVSVCVNKFQTIQYLVRHNVPCVQQLTRNEVAAAIQEDGKVIARDVLNGHSGQGIRVVRDAAHIGNSPLYTRYFKKDFEYRVHVAFGDVILIQQKKRGDNFDDSDRDRSLIRTNDNGWVFCINDLDCDAKGYRPLISDLALRAAGAVGINHGAVDVLVKINKRGGPTAVVCEINTAPALRNPSTLAAYVQAFQRRLGLRSGQTNLRNRA